MSCSDPACPCQTFVHPRVIGNPPGRDVVDYRVGDYTTFRHALLRPLAGELGLAGWHPVPGLDLGLQLLEWWAYLADILTFYNERAIQEVLLGTAAVPGDVRRIVRLLGYRPRPGIGASGVVAALADSAATFTVPTGFPIQGASAPDGAAQIFEVDADVVVGELGAPLPPSARFPSLPGAAATPWRGKVPVDSRGRFKNAVDAKALDPGTLSLVAGQITSIALDGVVTTTKPDDVLLVLDRKWNGIDPTGFAIASVRTVAPVWDAAGHAITQLEVLSAHDLPELPREQYAVMRPTKLAHLWLYHERYPGSSNPALIGVAAAASIAEQIFDPGGLFSGGAPSGPPEDPRVVTGFQMLSFGPPHGVAHLEAITRGISAGDPVLFEKRSAGGIAGLFQQLIAQVEGSGVDGGLLAALRLLVMQLVQVSGYAEDIWYADPPQMDKVGFGPPVGPSSKGLLSKGGGGPIPIPHSRIEFPVNPFLDVMAVGDQELNTIVVHYGWQEIGHVVPPPAPTTTTQVVVAPVPDAPATAAVPVLVEDVRGRGSKGWMGRTVSSDEDLIPPLRALYNLLPVSRGETVAREVLGSGDPTLANQEFALARAPLTYLADPGPRAVGGYRSTLRIRVDGIEWHEVPTFFDRAPTARVFVTREDDDQITHVRFGDGQNGARLPAGVDNVVASYRHGSGAAVPPLGTLTSVLRPQAGLAGIVNPVAVGGGTDPDPPDQLRRYAPRSVLTFDRAISGDDYETLAAQTPGVARAGVVWGWDAASQRSLVKVYVGDDDAAVTNARAALLRKADPNRPIVVAPATAIYPIVRLTVEVDPDHDLDTVRAAVVAALLDPGAAPFGKDIVRIGQVVYDSQIIDACMDVDGVVAVHDLRFALMPPTVFAPLAPSERVIGVWPGTYGDDTPPLPPELTALFGTSFDIAELYDPKILAWRLGIDPADLADPIALARLLRDARPGGTTGPGTTTTTTDPTTPDPGPRHVPGEGAFFLLLPDRLIVTAEVATDVL